MGMIQTIKAAITWLRVEESGDSHPGYKEQTNGLDGTSIISDAARLPVRLQSRLEYE